MSDLGKLIEGVEGNWWSDKNDVQSFRRHCEGAIPDDVRDLWMDAWGAYSGSLDAALRLREALLPGWDWLILQAEGKFRAVVAGPGAHEDGFEGEAANPARAWLLAVLRALAERGE